ncbi:MAG: hypothetical protein ACM3ML_31960 [Micromonosporaceae bacterium]
MTGDYWGIDGADDHAIRACRIGGLPANGVEHALAAAIRDEKPIEEWAAANAVPFYLRADA